MSLQSFALFLLFVLFVSVAAATDRPGGWTEIRNINDPHITSLANYAVTEYDKQTGSKLKLVKVLSGFSQVVAGINYRLILNVNDGSTITKYQAIVYEKSWEHFRKLTSFNSVHA